MILFLLEVPFYFSVDVYERVPSIVEKKLIVQKKYLRCIAYKKLSRNIEIKFYTNINLKSFSNE